MEQLRQATSTSQSRTGSGGAAAAMSATRAVLFFSLDPAEHRPVRARPLESAGEPGTPHPLDLADRAALRDAQVLDALERTIDSNGGDAPGEKTLLMMRQLQHSSLRTFSFPSEVDRAAAGRAVMVVLCHFAEGRTLLTDADGLYNAFLLAASRISRGNVFIALTNVPTAANDAADIEGNPAGGGDADEPWGGVVLADQAAVDDLAHAGGQLSIEVRACATLPRCRILRRLCLSPWVVPGLLSPRALPHVGRAAVARAAAPLTPRSRAANSTDPRTARRRSRARARGLSPEAVVLPTALTFSA